MFFAPQTFPALPSTHWGASLLPTWPKTLKDLHLELKVGFHIDIFFRKLAVLHAVHFHIFHNILIVFLFYEDSNFTWANAGATVFESVTSATKNNGNEGSDEEEASNNVDIHFEPIVSLPEVL